MNLVSAVESFSVKRVVLLTGGAGAIVMFCPELKLKRIVKQMKVKRYDRFFIN